VYGNLQRGADQKRGVNQRELSGLRYCTKVKVKVAGQGRRKQDECLDIWNIGGVGSGLRSIGQVVGFWGLEGRALNKPVNREVHRAVNRFSESIR
jgi:hypothetical protein